LAAIHLHILRGVTRRHLALKTKRHLAC